MPEKSETNTANWLPALLAAAAGALALFHLASPLTSQRPPALETTPDSLIADQRFPARLWEDPFEATATAQIVTNSLRELAEQLESARITEGTKVTILGILVEGSNYPEDREMRLRLRYAAQWALLEPPWRPADRAHLGCFEVPWLPARDLRSTTSIPGLETWPAADTNSLRVPFEWFQHYDHGTNDGSVLVLWLKEEEFADRPLRRLLQLHAALCAQCPDRPVRFKVIGPRSSDTLRLMALDGTKGLRVEGFCGKTQQLQENLEIFSPTASAPDVFLLTSVPQSAATTNRSAMTKQIVENGVRFTNLTILDTEMVAALGRELGRRRIPPFNQDSDRAQDIRGQPSIAVLFEGDTLFSRSMVNCFAAVCNAAKSIGTNRCESLLCNYSLMNADDLGLTGPPPNQGRPNANYVAYAYLRGLDGSQGRGEPKAAKDKSDTKKESAAVSTRYNQEQAEGNAQFDYAKGISRELKERIPDLKAVGIFGSDPYDKLILLQALRQDFPDAIYFTEDLDNRYLGPKVGSATRNMIVVSPFPLDYDILTRTNRNERFSGRRYTEFGSSAQTAVYCALRSALGDGLIGRQASDPSLYEVGRSQFISLPDTDPWDEFRGFWWPPWAGFIFMHHWLPTLVVTGCAGILLVRLVRPLYRAWRNLRSGLTLPHSWLQRVQMIERRRTWWLVIMGVVGLLSIAYCGIHFLLLSAQPDGEPFRWAEGVSIWPTELVRLFAAWLVILMLIYWWYQHRIWRVKLWALFVEGVDLQGRPFLKNLGHEAADMDRDLRMRDYCKVLSKMRRGRPRLQRGHVSPNHWERYKCGKVQSRELLTDYFYYGVWWKRALRVAFYSFLFILFASCLSATLGRPMTPTRSDYNWDSCILRGAILAFCFLIFYTVDATRLTERLIKRLSDAPTCWEQAYLDRLNETTRLEERDLRWYADVQFVAAQTREVGRLIFMPFIVIVIMLLSRTQYFDRWPWTPSLLIIAALSAAIVLFCAFTVRRCARKVRETALDQLEKSKLAAQTTTPSKRGYATLLQNAIDETKQISTGAYASLPQDNAVLALLMSSGGAGLLTFLDYLFSSG